MTVVAVLATQSGAFDAASKLARRGVFVITGWGFARPIPEGALAVLVAAALKGRNMMSGGTSPHVMYVWDILILIRSMCIPFFGVVICDAIQTCLFKSRPLYTRVWGCFAFPFVAPPLDVTAVDFVTAVVFFSLLFGGQWTVSQGQYRFLGCCRLCLTTIQA